MRDPYGLVDRWDSAPFGCGYARQVENVVEGRHGPCPFLAFDYRYKEDTGSGKDRQTQTYEFGCVSVSLPTALPWVEVTPESLFSRLGSLVGMQDIELESEDFNRAFRVRAADPKLACDVLPPRTMERLLAGDHIGWRVDGPTIVGWGRGLPSIPEMLARVDLLVGVVEGVPSFVWKDHGALPPGEEAS